MKLVVTTLACVGAVTLASVVFGIVTVIRDNGRERRRQQARREALAPRTARLSTDAEFRRIVRNAWPRPINDSTNNSTNPGDTP